MSDRRIVAGGNNGRQGQPGRPAGGIAEMFGALRQTCLRSSVMRPRDPRPPAASPTDEGQPTLGTKVVCARVR